MTKAFKLCLFTLLFSHSLVSASNKNVDKIPLVEQPLPIATVSDISGFVGERMEVNRNYLKKFPIERYIDFIIDRKHTAWDWTKAEQHGKWFESSFLSSIQDGDTLLQNKAKRQLARMIASQEENGYLGATARSYRDTGKPLRGMDPYELYFVFHALMTVNEETGDKDALICVKRLADYFLANFGPGKNEFWPSDLRYPENIQKELTSLSDYAGHGVHYGWEGTLLCDPMARLYQITGERKYLDWTKWVVDNIDRWSGWNSFSRLDSVADGTLTVDRLQPYVHSHTFHMNFMGFLRLYRITGDKSLLHKVQGAWDDISRRQMYITGGVSVAEHYEHDFVKPLSGNIVETCATMSWMQLTQMLLELTGDTRYADAIERIMFNHVFAAQDCEDGVCRYHTAPNGSKPDGYNGFFHGPDCCTASGHRIISFLPKFLYAERGTELFVNQYLDSKYCDKSGLAFTVSGNYPEEETIKIVMTSPKEIRKAINLRMPAWCKAPSIAVNSKDIGTANNGYIRIDRKWKAGDEIIITLPMEEHWIAREHHSEYSTYRLPNGEIMYNEHPADKKPFAFMRGPIVYALDMVWNKDICNDDADIMADFRVDIEKSPLKIKKPYSGIMGPAYRAEVVYKGKNTQAILTPFTNVGQWYRPGEEHPSPDVTAFTYGIWILPKTSDRNLAEAIN